MCWISRRGEYQVDFPRLHLLVTEKGGLCAPWVRRFERVHRVPWECSAERLHGRLERELTATRADVHGGIVSQEVGGISEDGRQQVGVSFTVVLTALAAPLLA